MGEIFPELGQVLVPISNLFEEYMRLFDEPEKVIHSEAKAADNKIDHLKKIIEDAAKDMAKDPSKQANDQPSNEPPNNSAVFEGESSFVSHTTEQENPNPTKQENPTPTEGGILNLTRNTLRHLRGRMQIQMIKTINQNLKKRLMKKKQ